MVVMSEPDNPVDIVSLDVDGKVVNPEGQTDLIQELGRLTSGGGRHRIFLRCGLAVRLIMKRGQECPKTQLLCRQGKIAC